MKKINESFQCAKCGEIVGPASKTCRNHCPYCFTSLHVDGDKPGDRESNCLGIMEAVDYQWKNGNIKILFECQKCGKHHWNKSVEDDNINFLIEKIKRIKKV